MYMALIPETLIGLRPPLRDHLDQCTALVDSLPVPQATNVRFLLASLYKLNRLYSGHGVRFSLIGERILGGVEFTILNSARRETEERGSAVDFIITHLGGEEAEVRTVFRSQESNALEINCGQEPLQFFVSGSGADDSPRFQRASDLNQGQAVILSPMRSYDQY